jgi:hypothetical protein
MIELVGKGNRPAERELTNPKFSSQPSTLDELRDSGWIPYSLAPLYAHVGVEDYIPGRFAAEDSIKGHPGEVHGMIYQFRHPIVARCGDWGLNLDVMRADCYEPFQAWLMAQFFVNREKGEVYIPMLCQVALADPFSYALGKTIPTSLDVFTFGSNKGRMMPVDQGIAHDKAKPYVDFVMKEADSNTIQISQAVLEGPR